MNQLGKLDANLIKFEARLHAPPDPPKTGSKFGRFLRSFGAFAGPVGFASAFFFPPAALIGASAYGLGQFGGYKDATKRQEQAPTPVPALGFPGMTPPQGTAVPASADPLNVIANRQAVTNDMIGRGR